MAEKTENEEKLLTLALDGDFDFSEHRELRNAILRERATPELIAAVRIEMMRLADERTAARARWDDLEKTWGGPAVATARDIIRTEGR